MKTIQKDPFFLLFDLFTINNEIFFSQYFFLQLLIHLVLAQISNF